MFSSLSVATEIIGLFAFVIVLVGNSAVILGLWPPHFLWSYYRIAKTKRLGLVLKILLLVPMPVPLVIFPVLGIVRSLLVGIGYEFVGPLVSTLEGGREQNIDKIFHYFLDGCWSTIEGSCTIVCDVTDFCFHSYFSYMDELSEVVHVDEKPVEIKLLMLPSCLLVGLLSVLIDVPMITIVALWKSPYMLFKGWKGLFEDLIIGREGPFLETVCVPFAGLAIILWPLAVVAAVICVFICSIFLGLYGGGVVHQESSIKMGLAYMISIVSMFDEYTNDILYMREGSYLPRPVYRKKVNTSDSLERKFSIENGISEHKNDKSGNQYDTKLASQRSRNLKGAFQQFKPMQVWDWLFRSIELNGRILLHCGLIDVADIEACILKGKCKKLSIKLPAYCILQCLLRSAKTDTSDLLITDEVELTKSNWPKDKVFEWFLGPLVIMKDQIKGLRLDENEEACLSKLIMCHSNEKPENWKDSGFTTDDIRRAQLQAIFQRLQGIVASMSRLPTFRRRFRNLVKVLYLEAMESSASSKNGEHSTKSRRKITRSRSNDIRREEDASERPSDMRDVV
ncbi:uncharacterized membrane protein At3g27390-like [Aristolochia californica]|uniref:uncharacterized membrane protein At3g27390-like n=1 Tax=Aristolochia californica TaxID=171875 RepID=UPI0035D6B21F